MTRTSSTFVNTEAQEFCIKAAKGFDPTSISPTCPWCATVS